MIHGNVHPSKYFKNLETLVKLFNIQRKETNQTFRFQGKSGNKIHGKKGGERYTKI